LVSSKQVVAGTQSGSTQHKQSTQVVESYSASKQDSSIISQRLNQSSAVAKAMNQSSTEQANITAVNNDKFASSLRETNQAQINQTKDMSVIDHHRKQSQNQKYSRTESTGFDSRANQGYESRTSISGYDSRATGSFDARAVAGYGQTWTNRQDFGASRQDQLSLHSAARQEHSASRYESSMSTSGSRQEQSRGLGFSTKEHQHSSSTSQQRSYRATSKTLIGGMDSIQPAGGDSIQPARRKTWAESSILHGSTSGYAIGSSYAQDYHQHQCPASKVYTQESPYKYSRQDSSGHKRFMPAN